MYECISLLFLDGRPVLLSRGVMCYARLLPCLLFLVACIYGSVHVMFWKVMTWFCADGVSCIHSLILPE